MPVLGVGDRGCRVVLNEIGEGNRLRKVVVYDKAWVDQDRCPCVRIRQQSQAIIDAVESGRVGGDLSCVRATAKRMLWSAAYGINQ